MKRLLCLLSALLLLVLPLASCSDGGDEAGEGLEIVATNFPLYDFASRVAGENASVKLLLTPDAESLSQISRTVRQSPLLRIIRTISARCLVL